MKKGYLKQTASTWVSAAVLAGGLATALLLVFILKMETRLQALEMRFDVISQELPLSVD